MERMDHYWRGWTTIGEDGPLLERMDHSWRRWTTVGEDGPLLQRMDHWISIKVGFSYEKDENKSFHPTPVNELNFFNLYY